MLVQAYFEWIAAAHAPERAEAAATLARTYLNGSLGEDRPEDVEVALMSVLDDPSPQVRRALAAAFAEVEGAPRVLVLSLVRDQAEVSGPLLARSPVLVDADLIDLAGHAERRALSAIALRPQVAMRVSGAIIARGELAPIHSLLCNAGAQIAPGHLIDVAARFATDAILRETLLRRPDLPSEARHILMRTVAAALGDFIGQAGFLAPARLTRITAEALESGTLEIAAKAGQGLAYFIDHLREKAELTPSLVLRAALSGALDFMAATLAELAEVPRQRVDHLVSGGSEAGVGALMRKAGLPDFLVPVLVAALLHAVRLPAGERGQGLHMGIIRAAQNAINSTDSEEALRLLALLRRYEVEAARTAARAMAVSMRARFNLPASLPMESGTTLDAPRQTDRQPPQPPAQAGHTAGDQTERLRPPRGQERPPALPVRHGPAASGRIAELADLMSEWRAEHAARDAEATSRSGADAARARQRRVA